MSGELEHWGVPPSLAEQLKKYVDLYAAAIDLYYPGRITMNFWLKVDSDLDDEVAIRRAARSSAEKALVLLEDAGAHFDEQEISIRQGYKGLIEGMLQITGSMS